MTKATFLRRFALPLSLLVGFCHSSPAQEWIWHPNNGAATTNNEVRFFRASFNSDGRPQKASLSLAVDNKAEVFLNNESVVTASSYEQSTDADLTSKVKAGENVILIRATNEDGPAALLVRLDIIMAGGKKQSLVSGPKWMAGIGDEKSNSGGHPPSAGNWVTPKTVAKLGGQPWGDPLKQAEATPADALTVLPGFKVELLHTATAAQGSWISMTVDPKGRLTVSPQKDDQPLLRVTLSRKGQVEKIEPLTTVVKQAMGMCYAHDSFYVNGHGPKGTGLYRLIDKNKNDKYEADEVQFLKKFEGEGEHGYHAVVEGPDGMMYVMNGNHTKVPQGIEADSPHQHYGEDLILPRQWDAGGHAVGILAPGGYVVRTDPEGKKWELLLAGFRNSYDFDFNADGEMFTFDSDMEWDWGLPWYRPTRIIHCVIGGEYGWRSGTSNEPEYYADTLPAAADIGLGSPTGVKFGTKSKFPEKYRKALYAFDWSYGRIVAVHLTPNGASYTGTFENLVRGKPLNLTDLEFGKDGAMYFTTGGRGTQSGLYRVSYVGGEKEKYSSPKPANAKSAEAARELRHKLEAFHGKKDSKAVDFAWPHLSSDDRFIRHAARIAIESQDVALWKDRAIKETIPQAGLTALMALARCSTRDTQKDLLGALKDFPLDSLTEEQKLTKLRILEISFARQGKPDPALAKLAVEKLDRLYPNASERMNRELSQLLIYLEAPGVVGKTLDLLARAQTQEEQVHYVFHLRTIKDGWTIDQRRKYFNWFVKGPEQGRSEVTYPRGSAYNVWSDQERAKVAHPKNVLQWFKDVDRDYGDGASYPKYLVNIRKEALATLSADERTQLGQLIDSNLEVAAWKPSRDRKFVQKWTVADVETDLDKVASRRDFKSGRAAFNDAQCVLCHRFGNEGGSIGPELTAASSKYSRKDILESIIDPSKVISDQYQNSTVYKKDGDTVTGRITDEDSKRVVITASPLVPESREEIKKSDIDRTVVSKISPMPTGLLDNLTRDEILDLLAYVESMGKANAKNFRR